MSEVINPPDYYFTGINFNPAFYAEDAGGLSQTLANTLYLRKTVPDTATAQETFTSGIVTPTINSTSTGFLNIVVPMVDSGSGLNVAVASRTISGQIHHYSDGDNCVAGAGVHLNNGINNNSTTNIHNGTGANPSGVVNIMTGTSSTGTVNIGTTGTTTNIKGNSAIGVVGSGTVTINRPITIGYTTYPITTNTQIGYKEQPTITWTALANTVIGTSTVLPIGNYSMTFAITNTGTYVPNYVSFGGASGVLANYRVPWVLSDTAFCLVNGAYIFTVASAGTISLVNRAANSQTLGDYNWTIIRIS